MEIKEFLQSLGINNEPVEKSGKYYIELSDSDDFARVYSKLGRNENLDLVNLDMGEDGTVASYMSDDFDITLSADYDSDKYELVIERASE